jgi:hypothetical protein
MIRLTIKEKYIRAWHMRIHPIYFTRVIVFENEEKKNSVKSVNSVINMFIVVKPPVYNNK